MEHEIAGQAVKAAMDGALVGTADRKKEPMTGKKALKAMERVMNALFFICGMVAVAFVLLISIYLIISGLPAILEIGPINFLFGTRWYASTGDFGIFAIILTSFAGTAGAILVGVPIGLMTAIFLSKVAPPKFAAVVHAAVELLAGIPSVVYGLVGMIVLVPAIQKGFNLGSGACLLAGICVTACAIRRMARSGGRRRTMVLACVYHIAILVGFKYTEFLTGGAVEVGWAPLGLSFFTFQQLWLLKEVYTGEYVPAPGDSLLLYGLFFPTVTSGPILRPGIFFPQLREKGFLHPDWSDAAAGIYAICCGTIKKVLLADAFGTVVNNGWVHLEELSAPAAWLVILGYTLQLYFDFSGYCDIAAGVARLFGLRLPMNFDSPYRSASVTEFWKRWHITLTTFLRECLYFPLGGSRRGAIRTYCNILIVFLVSGFWHGAGWTFLVWGALHGLAQVVERVWGRGRDRLPFVLRWGLTFLFVNIAWVFFRAPDCTGALELLGRAVTGGFAKPAAWLLEGLFAEETSAVQMLIPAFTPWKNILRVVLLYGAGMVAVLWPRNTIRRMEDFRPTLWRGAALTVLTLWCVLSFTGVTTFIYSNF